MQFERMSEHCVCRKLFAENCSEVQMARTVMPSIIKVFVATPTFEVTTKVLIASRVNTVNQALEKPESELSWRLWRGFKSPQVSVGKRLQIRETEHWYQWTMFGPNGTVYDGERGVVFRSILETGSRGPGRQLATSAAPLQWPHLSKPQCAPKCFRSPCHH